MFSALVLVRWAMLANAVVLYVWRRDNVDRPEWGAVAVAVMVLWTAFATFAYARHRRRTVALLLGDLGVAVGLIGVSPWIKGPDMQATVPGFWITGALVAWAIHGRVRGGLAAAVALAGADLAVRGSLTQTNYANLFLILLAGPVIGYLCGSIQQMAAERDAAERAAAVAAERARLARAVHDGVLQVLALVQRRGAEHAAAVPEFGDLARVAGDQEAALRALIRRQDAVVEPTDAEANAPVDVGALLVDAGRGRQLDLQVSGPGTPVLLAAAPAAELLAAVGACLDNVARHVGERAAAWLLLEEVDGAVVVTVRDDGPGVPDGRLDTAEAEGRMGVSESIRGRLRDLGGTADLTTGAFGTEWELTIPREAR